MIDKNLLLEDLCARLPYGVKCQIDYDNEEDTDLGIERYCDDRIVSVCIETEEIGLYEASEYFYPDEIKPYLRPLSSMTEDEKDELYDWGWDVNDDNIYSGGSTDANNVYQTYQKDLRDARWLIDWLNSHHFDYRGLIEKGLALEAPEEMYKTE